jgi:ABC-type transporter Mla subunit MlaD
MKQYIYVILLLTSILSSCSDNQQIYFLKANNVDGLSTKSNITLNGFVIGQISKITIKQNGQFILEIKIDKKIKIPTDSKIKIKHQDLLGTKGISIDLGQNKNIVSEYDTINLTKPETLLKSDSLEIDIQDYLKNITGVKQKDSILIELRRLNKNLEEQNKKKQNGY